VRSVIQRVWMLLSMNRDRQVFVELRRPTGYLHAELVIDDAKHPDWPWELIRDEGAAVIVAIDRPEGYERSPGIEVGGQRGS